MSGVRDSAGSVAKVCDGFFEDPRYVDTWQMPTSRRRSELIVLVT